MAAEKGSPVAWIGLAVAVVGPFISYAGVTGGLSARVETLERQDVSWTNIAAARESRIGALEQFMQRADATFEVYEQRRTDRARELGEITQAIGELRQDIATLDTKAALSEKDVSFIKEKLIDISNALENLTREEPAMRSVK